MHNLSDEWKRQYVLESNDIDPQPGHENVPGDPRYDDHLAALEFVVAEAEAGRLVNPQAVHRILASRLLGLSEEAGLLRECGVSVGGRVCPRPSEVNELLRHWLRKCNRLVVPGAARDVIKQLHVDFEFIHPFIDGNGRTGRLVMLNHELLAGLSPSLITYIERGNYFAWFRSEDDLLAYIQAIYDV